MAGVLAVPYKGRWSLEEFSMPSRIEDGGTRKVKGYNVYANAPLCCVMCKLPALFSTNTTAFTLKYGNKPCRMTRFEVPVPG
jgi:hypothetical protein